MAASDGMSKLSDDLRKLSARAKEAEDHAAAARAKAKADIEADRDDARAVGEQQAQALREKVDEGHEHISDRWADVQRSWDERVAAIRADIEARKAEHDLHKAEHRADRAEDEAEYAIAFAYSAIVEAEYSVLDAALGEDGGRRPVEGEDRSHLRAAPLPPGAEGLATRGPPPTLPACRGAEAAARGYWLPMNRNRDLDSAGTGRRHRDTALAGPGPLTPERDPSTQSRVVRREALFERLSATPADCLALVCAPAGSGKTMLVRTWLEDSGVSEHTAWVAVEPRERDAQHFWLAVVNALAEAIGGAVEPLGPTPGFRGEAVVERVLEDFRSVDEPLVLVIDDLHELQSSEALRWLELFLARRPAGLRIVLTSRSEPHLNMHRLRLAGELTEIREADLRFSAQEVAELLQASAIELSDEAVALLHDRTEGWVAGLRLAAISLAGHPDPERFVRDFSGSERSVAGYLMAEVLERQPPEVRELLLRSSILNRVTARLADAMTGHSDSERILLDLEEANAFVTSLDADRTWFRYHHLFADFLRLELRRADPASIDALHGIAARWYEEHGHPAEAVRHAQAASDWTYATRVLADSYISLILDGRLETVGELLATFPAEAAAEDVELAIVLAAARMFAGRRDETEAYIEVAERLADTVPQDRRRRFDLRVASTKLWLARRRVDLATALEAKREVEAALAAQSASDIARAADHRAAAVMNVGITELWSLRTNEARRHLEEALVPGAAGGTPLP